MVFADRLWLARRHLCDVVLHAFGSRRLDDADELVSYRFALIGFALPYCFVLNPELLLLSPDGGELAPSAVFAAVACTLLGIVPLAGGVTGQLRGNLHLLLRLLLLLASGLLLFARNTPNALVALIIGIALTAAIALIPSRWRKNV